MRPPFFPASLFLWTEDSFKLFPFEATMKKSLSLGLIALTLALSPIAFAQGHKDCDAIARQVNDLVEKLPEVGERIGSVKGQLKNPAASSETLKSLQNTLKTDESTIRSLKATIDKLLSKFCACCSKKSGANGVGKECEGLMKQIDGLVEKLPDVGERIGSVKGQLKNPAASAETHNSLQNTLKTDELTVRSLKGTIDKLMNKLCACCGKGEPSRPAQQPTPTTTDKVTDVLKTIGSSVSIGIGGGYSSGHGERHHGEDRHRTADKVSTDKTKTHTTSPTTTHKTVTSACKCHPCTCAPCTCH